MAVLDILRWPDVRLSMICRPVTGDVSAQAADMLETMYAASGRGLAAPQVGKIQRLFVMDATWKDGTPTPIVMINPETVTRSEAQSEAEEGCLSIPGVMANVRSPDEVTVIWTDPGGNANRADLTGFAARCAQHEMDHLDGIVTFDRVDAAERAELEAAYAR